MATRVLIIGGGPAGATIAKELDATDGVEVTLVDAKEYLEFPVALINAAFRATAEETADAVRSVTVPHTDYVKNGRVIVASATSVAADGKAVELSNGETLHCDYLVLATGSSYPYWKAADARTVDDRVAELQQLRERAAADDASILVLGGGAVGVEVGTEVAEQFPNARVSVVQGAPDLMPRTHGSLRSKARAWFENQPNTTLYLNERANAVDEAAGVYETSVSSTRIEASLVLPSIGIRPNSQPFQPHLSEHVDERGFVIVNDMLQVNDADLAHVFAIGDVNNVDCEKMQMTAVEQAKNFLLNFAQIRKGSADLKPFQVPGFAHLVTLGKGGGLLQVGGCAAFTGWTWRGSWPAVKIKHSFFGKVTGEFRA